MTAKTICGGVNDNGSRDAKFISIPFFLDDEWWWNKNKTIDSELEGDYEFKCLLIV